MPFTQENRFLKINTPLGEDVLLLTRFSGAEGVSIPFSLELDVISQNHSIAFKDIIGQNVTVSLHLDNGRTRFFNGIISRFSQAESSSAEGGEVRISNYSATVVPWFWLLTRTSDSRIFQELAVPDIVEKIFKEKNLTDYKINLHGSYEKRDYCVQYRETDFDFISRLLEEEGIYYYFEHEDGKHTMVLADVPDEHKPCPNQESARCHPATGSILEEYTISSLELMQEIRAGKYSLNDFNFETPATDLTVEVPSQQSAGPGEREMYDYPGGFSKRNMGDRLANIRMQEEEAAVTIISGSSNCRAFTSGYRFTLREYHRSEMNDKDYVLLSLSHMASEPYSSSEESGLSYMNSFTCIPFDVPFRPRRKTRKPVVEGVQTAIVVGPGGEDIYTDEHGRVKVQFHWDREGKKDENSSCWIRVSQLWAGAGWGAMHVPHVGHEVIVNFIEGDPDRPIITGRVYHGNNKPPDELPANKTKNYIQSWGDNDIIFENKEGDKCIHIKQACGNEIRMHESTPDIEIKQECGNEILMHQAEGIQIRDKYGNEIVMDAVAGTMKLRSPSHESVIELGKSLYWGTMSNAKEQIQGDRLMSLLGNEFQTIHGSFDQWVAGPVRFKWDGINFNIHGGAVQDAFIGGKISSLFGGEFKFNHARVHEINYWKSTKNIGKQCKIDSKEETVIIGGGGDSDISKVVLNDKGVLIKSGKGSAAVIQLNNDGDITISTKKDLVIEAKGKIYTNQDGSRISELSKEAFDLKVKNIMHEHLKVTS